MADRLRRRIPGDWAERLQLGLVLVLQLAIAAVLAGALFEGRWLLAFVAALVLGLTFLPAVLERQLGVQLPVELTLFNTVFLYAAFGLGEVRQFYERFWWWDLMLHSLSAVVLGLTGFVLTYIFHMTQRIHMSPSLVALVSFGFAVTLGTLWELFEYFMDLLFGLHMQRGSLNDTMTDLLVDTIGALAAASVGYFYVKDGDSLIGARVIRAFVDKNPHIFRHRR